MTPAKCKQGDQNGVHYASNCDASDSNEKNTKHLFPGNQITNCRVTASCLLFVKSCEMTVQHT